MKNYKWFLNLALVIFIAITMTFFTGCNTEENEELPVDDAMKSELPILLWDNGVDQETQLAQIKADLLKKNNGYKPTDIVTLVIELSDVSLVELYNEDDHGYKSVSDFGSSEVAKDLISSLDKSQDAFIKTLNNRGYVISVEHKYNTVINAVSITTEYQNIAKIENMNHVKNVMISETYNKPLEESSGNYEAVENVVDVYEDTGIFNSQASQYTGAGTTVSILDSGFDCSHQAFNTKQIVNPLFSMAYVSEKLAEMNSSKTSNGLKVTDVYHSEKIPYAYDYADKDFDVNPFESNHGTHVAGIIGGKDERITGVAVDTQLVLMKVFPDVGDGADAADIIAALEDSVKLGVDVINLSLGASCGFSREVDEVGMNNVYDAIDATGISIVVAASNSYSSAYGGEFGNTNKVTNPDSATVGSPSTYPTALSVASISGTKSRYLLANDKQVLFFNESNNIKGDQNDFFKQLVGDKTGDVVFEYVTIPGVGLSSSYAGLDVEGKIVVVKRGQNTFEEKANIAKSFGAAGIIIYNNVAGDIIMSMGKKDAIPAISISKEDGTILASQKRGTITFNKNFQAGPFMSNFSSWGPNPDLKLKPEITAHGGNITSSVHGGGYDTISGTSMACPNMSGVVILIRQALKEKYPDKSAKEVTEMCYQLLMSTATIANNEQGNPYSPRKQGAGLASLADATNADCYLTVDNESKAKLELGDDKNKTGVYTMPFNIVNISDKTVKYAVSIKPLTESVDSSDEDFVAEKPYVLSDKNLTVASTQASVSGNIVTVNPNETVKITVTYELTSEDKNYIESKFPNGMYVEGFVILTPVENTSTIDLNIPFLGFYGDWTKAPMFDKTYFEVESEAYNNAIDYEDKIKADYYATTPYGSYYASYIIPLGSYLYDIDTSLYEEIPATEEHCAITSTFGCIDGISQVYAGLLRNAKKVTFTLTDVASGEVLYEFVDNNAHKSYSNGSQPIPYFELLGLKAEDLQLVNNKQYKLSMLAELDYEGGGLETNDRNTFEFTFYMDNQAPQILNATYEKEYDKAAKIDRYYVTLTVYDNHYVQSISPICFTGEQSYAVLTKTPVPVYGEKNQATTVRFEITDYLNEIKSDTIVTSCLGFMVDDYALNSNIYYIPLPGVSGDLKFTENGKYDGSNQTIVEVGEGEIVDLIQYLSSNDPMLDESKDYLKYLQWTTSNENVAICKEGKVQGISSSEGRGRCKVTVTSLLTGKTADITILVSSDVSSKAETTENCSLEEVRFTYFDTLFAHQTSGSVSEIGKAGERVYINNAGIINCYPGESVKLSYEITPWYLPSDRYEVILESTVPEIATIDENGVFVALEEGQCAITINVLVDGKLSALMDTIDVNVKSEFVIENRALVAYKGRGGDVVIPDDEGIMTISAYAFSLYDINTSMGVTEDDYDANKVAGSNDKIRSVVIPDGVTAIDKYAFYNCTALESVEIPESCIVIRDLAFYGCKKLEKVEFVPSEDTEEEVGVVTIGRYAFYDCENLTEFDFSRVYAIGMYAFESCYNLNNVDLSVLRNCGAGAFRYCTSLTNVTFVKDTKLSNNMFEGSGITSLNLDVDRIPDNCFRNCYNLTNVSINQDIVYVGKNAFNNCSKLETVNLLGSCQYIDNAAFKNCSNLTSIALPNSEFTLGNEVFSGCSNLSTLVLGADTVLPSIGLNPFNQAALENIIVSTQKGYKVVDGILMSLDETEIILVPQNKELGDYVVPSTVTKIGPSSFSGNITLTSLTITNPNCVIGDGAFSNCINLKSVNLPEEGIAEIPNNCFDGCKKLDTISNLDKSTSIGDFAFRSTSLTTLTLNDCTVGNYAFNNSLLTEVVINGNVVLGSNAFRGLTGLHTVTINGTLEVGKNAFYNCINLENINFDKLVGNIGSYAFSECVKLSSVNLVNVNEIGDYAFSGCSFIDTISLGSVKTIGEGAFTKTDVNGAPKLANVNLGDSLTSIGKYAFKNCTTLSTITIPNTVVSLGEEAFMECYKLSNVVLSENIKTIENKTFSNCSILSKINLENVEVIKDSAFILCQYLTSIDLRSCREIEFGAFASCARLAEVKNANSIETLGGYVFQGCCFPSIDLSNCKVLGEAALSNNRNITEFVFSQNLEKIEPYCFNGCANLSKISYGSQKIEEGEINDNFFISDGALYQYLSNGELQLTFVPQGLKIETLEVLAGTNRIELYGASLNKSIKKIILPDTLRAIGHYAFFGLTNLETVEFRSFVAPVLESAPADGAVLQDGAPGYDVLYPQFHVVEMRLFYFNFIDLVGSRAPINMILPINEGIVGYDTIIYEAYFGKVEDATRSDYECKDTTTLSFIEYYNKLPQVGSVSLEDDSIISETLRLYNSLIQDLTKFGYTASQVSEMDANLKALRNELNGLKLEISSDSLKRLQADLLSVSTTFSLSDIETFRRLTERLNNVSANEKAILNLENYNKLMESYNTYLQSISSDSVVIGEIFNNSFNVHEVLTQVISQYSQLAIVNLFTRKYF